MNKKSTYILIIGVSLFIFTTPILLTRHAICSFFNLTQTGQIGDTIGGVTAPFINLLGAILVFLSFKEQIKANEIQTSALQSEMKRNEQQRKYNSLMTDINNLRMDINEYRLLGKSDRTGSNALYELETTIKNYDDQMLNDLIKSPVFKNFYFLLATTENILKNIQQSELIEFEKKDLSEKLLYLYTSKVSVHAQNILDIYIDKKVEHELITMLIKADKTLKEYIFKNHI